MNSTYMWDKEHLKYLENHNTFFVFLAENTKLCFAGLTMFDVQQLNLLICVQANANVPHISSERWLVVVISLISLPADFPTTKFV